MYPRQMELNINLLEIINNFMQQNQVSATEMDAALNSVSLKVKDAMMQEYMQGIMSALNESHEKIEEKFSDFDFGDKNKEEEVDD